MEQIIIAAISLLPVIYAIIKVAFVAKQVTVNEKAISELKEVTNKRIDAVKSQLLSLTQDANANSKATVELTVQVKYLSANVKEFESAIKELRALIETLRKGL
jgi:peptidoglycan hydrolase CwlO-like protein